MSKGKKQALGRGIDVIMKDVNTIERPTIKSDNVLEIPIDKIKSNPLQPRTDFDEESIKELAQSIEQLGLIQPITVRKTKEGSYQLVSGERRFRASDYIGKKKIIAYVRGVADREMLEMALVENIQRKDLNPIEIALSFQRLIEEIKFTQEELSKRVGKKRATVTNYLRLLKLNPIIQMGMRDNFISMGHGRALISIPDEMIQLKIYEQILEKQLSVRDTEDLVKQIKEKNTPPQKPTTSSKTIPDFVNQNDLQQMNRFFGKVVKVSIDRKGRGKITIPFDSAEEFAKIQKKFL